MSKTYKFRELVHKLNKYDKRFVFWERRGKGSERMIFHPDIDGQEKSIPVKCHGGNTEVHKYAINDIKKRFNLPPDLL